MASSTFTGLEIGTYSVKAMTVTDGGELNIVDFAEEKVPAIEPESADEQREEQPSDVPEEQQQDKVSEQPEEVDELETGDVSEERQLEPWEYALNQLRERDYFENTGPTVTYLPGGQIMSIRLDVPFGERDQVEEVLPHLLEDHLPLDPQQLVYDFHLQEKFRVGEDTDETHEAIVGFARREQLGAFLDKLSDHEVDPAVIGAPQLMLNWLAESHPQVDESQTNAFIDIGHKYTRILVKNGDRIGISRSISKGGKHLTEAIAGQLDKTEEQAEHLKKTEAAIMGSQGGGPAEEQKLGEIVRGEISSLIREIQRTLDSLYEETRLEVDQAYITGGTSQLEGIVEYIESALDMPAVQVSLRQFQTKPETPAEVKDLDTSSLGLPFAMSTQQIQDSRSERTVNLRKDEFEYRGKSSYIRKQLTRYGVVFAGLFVLLIGLLWTRSMELTAQKNSMRQAVQKQTKQLFGDSLTDHTQIQKRLTGKSGEQRAFVPDMSAYQIYYKLMSQVPEDFDFTTDWVEVDLSRNLIQLRGETKNIQAMEKLKSYLAQVDCIQNVQDEDVSTDTENRASFELQIQSGCS
jgi:general secretion pathway protein L